MPRTWLCAASKLQELDPMGPSAPAAIRTYVEGALADEEFVSDVTHFVGLILTPGRVNALSQALLKLTSPGGLRTASTGVGAHRSAHAV